MTRAGIIAVTGGALCLAAAAVFAQSHMSGGHGTHAHMHDAATMPGLRGAHASPEESADLAVLFRNFETLTREVTLLPNGIRTVTRSDDPDVMAALVAHSVGMIDRVHAQDDPEILIQSPTLDVFFQHGDQIASTVTVEEVGLVVVQTSDIPEVVAAMHLHAAEVTAMVDRGMAAVHDMMMEQGRGH